MRITLFMQNTPCTKVVQIRAGDRHDDYDMILLDNFIIPRISCILHHLLISYSQILLFLLVLSAVSTVFDSLRIYVQMLPIQNAHRLFLCLNIIIMYYFSLFYLVVKISSYSNSIKSYLSIFF